VFTKKVNNTPRPYRFETPTYLTFRMHSRSRIYEDYHLLLLIDVYYFFITLKIVFIEKTNSFRLFRKSFD